MSETARAIDGAGAPHPRPPEVEADTAERGEPETSTRPGEPGFAIEVTGVRAIEHAAAPTLSFGLRLEDDSGREVFMAGLRVQIQIEPAKRRYDEESKAKLTELFGDPHRWSVSAQRMHWTSESLLVPSFRGSTEAEIEVLCNYDVELAAAKYFHSVTEGEVPARLPLQRQRLLLRRRRSAPGGAGSLGYLGGLCHAGLGLEGR